MTGARCAIRSHPEGRCRAVGPKDPQFLVRRGENRSLASLGMTGGRVSCGRAASGPRARLALVSDKAQAAAVKPFAERIAEGVVVCAGAMGTMLYARGV